MSALQQSVRVVLHRGRNRPMPVPDNDKVASELQTRQFCNLTSWTRSKSCRKGNNI
jgi:hypothetical protein